MNSENDLVAPLRQLWTNEYDATGKLLYKAEKEIERLYVELKSQTFWAELLSGDKCYCVAGDVGVCIPCAYRQTMRQNEEVRSD